MCSCFHKACIAHACDCGIGTGPGDLLVRGVIRFHGRGQLYGFARLQRDLAVLDSIAGNRDGADGDVVVFHGECEVAVVLPGCSQLNGVVRNLPGFLIHRIGRDAVDDVLDAGRVRVVVHADSEGGLKRIKMLLNPVRVGICPLLRIAVAYEIVVLQGSGTGRVAVGLVGFGVTRVRDGHELIGQAEVQVTLVEVVPVVIAVIPGAVDLVPLAVQFHGVPGMGVVGVPSLTVLNARGGQQLAVCGFIGLASAETSGEGALGAAPFQGVIVLHLVKEPVMQLQGLGVFRTIGLLVALGHRCVHAVGDRGIVRIGDLDAESDVQIVHLRCLVHEEEVVIVCSAGGHGERVVV